MKAAKAGARRYRGAPCLRGHDGERYTSTGACVQCAREYVANYRQIIRRLLDSVDEIAR